MFLLHISNSLSFLKPPLINYAKIARIDLHPIPVNLIIFIPPHMNHIPSSNESHAKPVQFSFWRNGSFKNISKLVHHSDKSTGFYDVSFCVLEEHGPKNVFTYKCSVVFLGYMEFIIFMTELILELYIAIIDQPININLLMNFPRFIKSHFTSLLFKE